LTEETYKQTDQEYLRADHNQHRGAGSTASTDVLVGEPLLVANVGDSRAVICRNGKGEYQKSCYILVDA
jgi:protein phosphatase 1L